MLISVYSDSTALPRKNLTPLSDTWPYLLETNLEEKLQQEVIFLNRSFGGYKLHELLSLFKLDMGYYYDDKSINQNNSKTICIFTSGIVDGSPRPISYKLKKLDKVLFIGKFLSVKVVGFLQKFRPVIQQKFSYTPVNLDSFASDLSELGNVTKNLDVTLLLIETALPHEFLESRSPGITASIKKFNAIKKDSASRFNHFHYIEFGDSFRSDMYVSKEDGHHFNKEGHIFFYKKILDALLELQM
jgi:hypothetical protein